MFSNLPFLYRKTKADSFMGVMLKECTSNQNMYTLLEDILLEDNHSIVSLSDWHSIDEYEISDDCKDTCTPLNSDFVDTLISYLEVYPKENVCKFKLVEKSWLDFINSTDTEYRLTM